MVEEAGGSLLLPVVPGDVGGDVTEAELAGGAPQKHGPAIPAPPVHPTWHRLNKAGK